MPSQASKGCYSTHSSSLRGATACHRLEQESEAMRVRLLTLDRLVNQIVAHTQQIEAHLRGGGNIRHGEVIDPSSVAPADPGEGQGRTMLSCSACGSSAWSVVSWDGEGREQDAATVVELRCLRCGQIVELTDLDLGK
jgi:hypothetical protein